MSCLTILCVSCQTQLIVIRDDQRVTHLPANSVSTNVYDGYFVPTSRMLEILRKLNDAELQEIIKGK